MENSTMLTALQRPLDFYREHLPVTVEVLSNNVTTEEGVRSILNWMRTKLLDARFSKMDRVLVIPHPRGSGVSTLLNEFRALTEPVVDVLDGYRIPYTLITEDLHEVTGHFNPLMRYYKTVVLDNCHWMSENTPVALEYIAKIKSLATSQNLRIESKYIPVSSVPNELGIVLLCPRNKFASLCETQRFFEVVPPSKTYAVKYQRGHSIFVEMKEELKHKLQNVLV